MKQYTNEQLSFHQTRLGSRYSELEFINCTFSSINLSPGDHPNERAVAKYIRLHNCCYVESGGIDKAIVEEAVIDNLKTRGLLLVWAMAFKHVIIQGRTGRMLITNAPSPGLYPGALEQQAWENANFAFYQSVDWALDISRAEFQECEIRGIPARLIRRDPLTQAVVKRENALNIDWAKLGLRQTIWQVSINLMLQREDSDMVLIAPKRDPEFKELLRGLDLLRAEGIAERD